MSAHQDQVIDKVKTATSQWEKDLQQYGECRAPCRCAPSELPAHTEPQHG